MSNDLITQAHFAEEGLHQWVLNYKEYRVVVRKVDNSIEVIIREKITRDPNFQDWQRVLKTVNSFYQKKRIAERGE